MKKILVPVDFSRHSENALEMASAFAKANNSKIILLHMMGLKDNIASDNSSDKMVSGIYHMRLAQKQFAELRDKAYLKDMDVTEIVKGETDFKQIKSIAAKHGIDLIIMGSHGVTSLKDQFVGSNTEKVIRSSEVPVFVIKGQHQNKIPKRVTLACDFKTDDLAAYTKAIKFLNSIGAKVDLVFVNVKGENFQSTWQIQKQIKSFLNLAHFGEQFTEDDITVVNDFTFEAGIYYHADKTLADAIAIITHGRKGLSHFFYGSVAEHLTNHSAFPVFTFKI